MTAGLTGVTVDALLRRAGRLGLTWSMRLATVVDGSVPNNVQATLDGDTTIIRMISLVGPLAAGFRVFVVVVPPAGNYITGVAQSHGPFVAVTYVPEWNASTSPILNDGTLVGRYVRVGAAVHVWVSLTFGSLTTGGSGNWSFGLPLSRTSGPGVRHGGGGFIKDNSPVRYHPVTPRGTGDFINIVHPESSGSGLVTATAPFTWATDDELEIYFCYETDADPLV